MKAWITILIVALLAGTSCQHKPKSRIEDRFERHLQTKNLMQDFVKVDSVIPLDSINISSLFGKYISLKDSVHDALMEEVKFLTKNMEKANRADFPELIEIALKLRDSENATKEKEVREKISIFLEDIPDSKTWFKQYRIVGDFKSGKKTFYANDVAFEDSIVICNSQKECSTRKLQRITEYLTEYLMVAYAPEAVLLDKAKIMRSKLEATHEASKSKHKAVVDRSRQREFLEEPDEW